MAKKGGEWGGGTSTGSLIDDHRPLMTKVTTPTQKASENIQGVHNDNISTCNLHLISKAIYHFFTIVLLC